MNSIKRGGIIVLLLIVGSLLAYYPHSVLAVDDKLVHRTDVPAVVSFNYTFKNLEKIMPGETLGVNIHTECNLRNSTAACLSSHPNLLASSTVFVRVKTPTKTYDFPRQRLSAWSLGSSISMLVAPFEMPRDIPLNTTVEVSMSVDNGVRWSPAKSLVVANPNYTTMPIFAVSDVRLCLPQNESQGCTSDQFQLRNTDPKESSYGILPRDSNMVGPSVSRLYARITGLNYNQTIIINNPASQVSDRISITLPADIPRTSVGATYTVKLSTDNVTYGPAASFKIVSTVGDIRVKRVGMPANSVTQTKLDNLSPVSTNPADFNGVPVGYHTAYVTDLPGYDEYAYTCWGTDNACTASSNTSSGSMPAFCANGFCSIRITPLPVAWKNKVEFNYVPTPTTTNRTGSLRIKRVDAQSNLSPTITSATQSKIDTFDAVGTNPADFSLLSAPGNRTAYVTDLPGYDEYMSLCDYDIGASECTGGSYFPASCSNGLCSRIVGINVGQVKKVQVKYIATTTPTIPVPVNPSTPTTFQQVTVLPWTGPSTAAAGSNVNYTLNWRGGPLSDTWQVFVHVVASNGETAAYTSFWPTPATTQWSAGNLSIGGSLALPGNISAGTYKVMVGLYKGSDRYKNFALGTGVVGDSQSRYQVGTLTVTAPTPTTPTLPPTQPITPTPTPTPSTPTPSTPPAPTPTSSTPFITSLSPSSGPKGTVVTATGRNFTSTNDIQLTTSGYTLFAQGSSSNGTTMTFTIPTQYTLAAGTVLSVFVENDYGFSDEDPTYRANPAKFTVTGSTSQGESVNFMASVWEVFKILFGK